MNKRPASALIIALCFVNAVLLAETEIESNSVNTYAALNERETRLFEYKDDRGALEMKISMLALINASRARSGAPPLKLDILASRVANKQAAEAAKAGYSGHYNLAGQKPYHRYAFAGGVDHVSENAAGRWSSAPLDPEEAWSFMTEAHAAFMAEKPPYDGHRVNVINKDHTHVGLGYAVIENYFAYYEEYIDRYFESLTAPAENTVGAKVMVQAVPKTGYYVYAVMVYYEKEPQPLSAKQADEKGAYPDYTSSRVAALWPYQLDIAEDGSCSFPIALNKAGLYYVQIYLDKAMPKRSGSFKTADKIQASGLVLRAR